MSQVDVSELTPAYLRAAEDLRHNPGQWQAYESTASCVILAGPGSGKTKTLTIKLARMVSEDISAPQGVACVTYNNECVRELRRRLERLGVRETTRVFLGTIHSFCLKYVLAPYGRLAGLPLPSDLVVASPTKQDRLFERAVANELGDERPSRWRTRFDEYRRTRLDRGAASWREDERLAGLVERYERSLRAEGLIDFDDILLYGLQIIESQAWVRRALRARFPILIVDEYQDLGVPLHRIVLSLCFDAGVRLLAVGDPDQSIYGFTGARPQLLRKLWSRNGVERVTLPFNYRSGKTIVAASEAVLGEARGYEAKGSEAGTIDFHECLDGLEQQATRICREIIPEALQRRTGRNASDIAVLYLDKNDGDVIARHAAAADLKYIRIDRGAPYPKSRITRWLEDCAAWCAGGWATGAPRLSGLLAIWVGLNDRFRDQVEVRVVAQRLVHFLLSHRTPDMPLRDWLTEFKVACLEETFKLQKTLGDEAESFAKLLAACSSRGELHALTVRSFAGQAGAPDHLNLITLHSAKGLEFDVVVLMGMEQGRIPSWAATSIESKREPRRVFYVGLTRAKHEVHMTYSGWTANQYGRRFDNGPSEFLIEVQNRLAQS